MGRVRTAGIVATALLAAAALVAFAPAPEKPPVPPASTSSATAPPHRPRIHSLVGEVVEVRPSDQMLIVRETLRDGSPKTTTFSTTAKTQIVRGVDAATLGDVKPNDHVTIKYREDAAKKKEAVSIRITPSATPKAPPPVR